MKNGFPPGMGHKHITVYDTRNKSNLNELKSLKENIFVNTVRSSEILVDIESA